MIKVYIASLPNGFFGSAGQSWLTLNLEKISNNLVSNEYKVIYTTIDQIPFLDLKSEDYLIYTSSDENHIRSYLKDIMYFANKKCTIVPNYESLLAHENKGFQQLFRAEKEFGNLSGGYHYDINALPLQRPLVFKLITGAGSSGVFLVKNDSDFKKVKSGFFSNSLKRNAIKQYRKHKLSADEYEIYNYRHTGFNNYVYQEFIEGLDCDYKILVFGQKYYGLRRQVREGDFRASGSGGFSFVEIPQSILDFAESIFKTLDVPYASLDVALTKQNECHLIEYQALNFGPYTLVNSTGYYSRNDELWFFTEQKSDLEQSFSLALFEFIQRKECE